MIALLLALSACSTPSEPARTPAPAPAAPPPAPVAPPMDHAEHAEHHEGAETSAPAPDSYAGAVAALRARQEAVAALLAAGKLKDVHPEAKAIMDLAVALPGKAAALPPEAKGTVALKALDLKEKADTMHDSADKGDAAGAKAAFDAVVADIDALAQVSK